MEMLWMAEGEDKFGGCEIGARERAEGGCSLGLSGGLRCCVARRAGSGLESPGWKAERMGGRRRRWHGP